MVLALALAFLELKVLTSVIKHDECAIEKTVGLGKVLFIELEVYYGDREAAEATYRYQAAYRRRAVNDGQSVSTEMKRDVIEREPTLELHPYSLSTKSTN